MTTITITNLDESYYELGQELQKLALLVPTIPTDRYLSELELIEFVIAYIRQLQQLLLPNQYDNKSASTRKISFRSLPPHLFNQLILRSPTMQTNESSSTIHRSPLATIDLDNTQLS